MPKIKAPETPKERFELAKRYLKNAKEILKKAGVDRRRGAYIDLKHISEASGTAYLAGLEALKALFLWEGLITPDNINSKLRKVEVYTSLLRSVMRIGKDRDLLMGLFKDVYDILHINGYYRELQSKKSIDDGFEKVERIIRIVEKHISERP